jgi:deoxyribodipyrimidine photo-lyase
MPATPVHVVWFKRDLRVVDHAPLAEASARGPVLPLFVAEPDLWRQDDASGRQWEARREGLVELRAALAAMGQPLVVRSGDAVAVLESIRRTHGIAALWSHMETGNGWTFARDRRVAAWARAQAIPWHERRAFGVVRGLKLRRGWVGQWEALMREPLAPTPAALPPVAGIEPGALPSPVDLGLAEDPCPGRQRGGRSGGLALLASFLDRRGANYHREMSSPLSAEHSCSRLSLHLATGTLGLREVVHVLRARRAELAARPDAGPRRRALAAFESRLHWHCHFIQKLESEPGIEFAHVHAGYEGMRPDVADPGRLAAWRDGRTGWPFVDACMRMLDATGWINFRMRAMLVAIASYHLWLPWRDTGLVLARRFTDYEPGIHWPQVQMQSGVTGINIPRIYNPVKQSRDQDPRGAFIRRWLPELARVPEAWIHTPWLMPPAIQRECGCVIDRDYPSPVVDHEQAAREARARLIAWRRRPGMSELNRAVLAKHGSRKRRVEERPAVPTPQGELFGADVPPAEIARPRRRAARPSTAAAD